MKTEIEAGTIVKDTGGNIGVVQKVINAWAVMARSHDFEKYSEISGERDRPLADLTPVAMATEKQVKYLLYLEYSGDPKKLTKQQASEEISSLKRYAGKNSCHYCGAPASGFGFFDEAACGQCGGQD